jgi:ApbE superfamily uncharacterized protein (UPF0280 family)
MSWAAPQDTLLPDGKRLHLHHGPIDLIVGVSGEMRDLCFERATDRFQTILIGLMEELDALRRPLTPNASLTGPVAKRMANAARSYPDVFVTPMAAVAGAVADEVLAAMLSGNVPRKAYVNNGGDIAFHLSEGETFDVLSPAGLLTITSQDSARGIATSGWQGRSHSLGIADAVTVVAKSAAAADVAATLIANATNLPGHPAIGRCPAKQLSPDSDLGERLVTTHVGHLPALDVDKALQAGTRLASDCAARGLVKTVAVSLQGQSHITQNSFQSNTTGVLAHA